MKGLKFNSQICTTMEQSERLIALGLKKETADLWWVELENGSYALCIVGQYFPKDAIPAWSLHRLIEMADTTAYINEGREDEHELWFCMDKCFCWNNHESFYATNLYDSLIYCIEWLIKEGYFPKEYLVDLTGTDSHQDMVDAFGYAFEAMKAKKEE